MTEERSNAEKLEALWDAFDQEGAAGAGRMLDQIYDEGVEFNPIATAGVGGTTYRGLDGVLAFFGELDATIESLQYEVPQFHAAGENLVVVLTRIAGIVRETGRPLRQDLSLVYEFGPDGLAHRVTGYETPAEALEAAQRGHADA
ncbi:MAG TPA: nuclear transport factor 2 family protein [Solirubrobacterales bacterium]